MATAATFISLRFGAQLYCACFLLHLSAYLFLNSALFVYLLEIGIDWPGVSAAELADFAKLTPLLKLPATVNVVFGLH